LAPCWPARSGALQIEGEPLSFRSARNAHQHHSVGTLGLGEQRVAVVDAAVEHRVRQVPQKPCRHEYGGQISACCNADSSVSSAPTCTVVPVEATQTLNTSPSITGLWPELFGKHPENTGR
jgi:hypothetical protein